MIKKIHLFLFLIPLTSISQERILEINNDLKKGSRKVRSSLTVVDESNGNFGVFLDDNKNLYGFLYNSDYKEIGKISSEGLPKKYKEIIGYTITDEKVRLFLKDKEAKAFGSVLFNLKDGRTEEKVYAFILKNEVYLSSYNHGDTFYLMSVTKNSDLLNFYILQEGKGLKKESIDFSATYFTDKNWARQNLSSVMESTKPRGLDDVIHLPSFDVGKIDPYSPNSIEITSEKLKMYPKKHGFLLTIENDKVTYVIEISTLNLDYKVFTIQKPEITHTDPKTNSFILDDKIYQISASSQEMKFSVKLIDSGKELKNISLKKDEEIFFKNTPIIQEGGAYSDYREMEKTSKFLRKISSGDIGVSVINSDNDFIITIGAKKETTSGGGLMMMSVFGAFPIATFGALSVSINPTFFAYNNYGFTKATRIECLFDKDVNHLDGDIPENVFDRIDKTADKLEVKYAETVFKLDDFYIWGVYNNKVNKYSLYKF